VVIDIPDIEGQAIVPGQVRAPVDLRPAGDAGQHCVTPPLFHRVARDVSHQQRPRTDEAHLAAKDVDELRQLVETGPADEPGEPGNRRAGRHLNAAASVRPTATGRVAHLHRPELQDREGHAVATRSDLAEDDWSAHAEPDAEGDPGQNRREQEEREGRPDPIERDLRRSLGAVASSV
jgi:hypothetical protein